MNKSIVESSGRPVMIFDYDGTRGRGASLGEFFWTLALHDDSSRNHLQVDRLQTALRDVQLRRGNYADYVGLFCEYVDGAIMARAFRMQRLQEIAVSVAKARHDWHYVFTDALLLAARAHGYATAIVSQSPQIVVEAVAAYLEVDHVFGQELYVDEEGNVCGNRVPDKTEVVSRLFAKYAYNRTNSIAIGDTVTDVGMFLQGDPIGGVGHPLLFNGNADVMRHGAFLGGCVPMVREQRDMIMVMECLNQPVEPGNGMPDVRLVRLESVLPEGVAVSVRRICAERHRTILY